MRSGLGEPFLQGGGARLALLDRLADLADGPLMRRLARRADPFPQRRRVAVHLHQLRFEGGQGLFQ